MNTISQPKRWQMRTSERVTILVIGDFLVAALALFFALYIWAAGDAWMKFSLEFIIDRPPFWYFLLPFMWIILLVELYDIHRASNHRETFKGIGLATLIFTLIYLLFYFTSEPNSLPRRGVSVFIFLAAVFTLVWRLIYIRMFTAPHLLRRALIIGAGNAGQTLIDVIADLWPPPFFTVGLVDDDPKKLGKDIGKYSVLGNSHQLLDIINEKQVTDLILAISGEIKGSMFQAILSAQEMGINLSPMPQVYEELLSRVPIFLLEAEWIVRSFVEKTHTSTFYHLSKSLLDFAGGLVGSLIMAVFFPWISLATLLESGFPIFFAQERLGRGGQPFKIFKFRTMERDAEKDGYARMAEENDQRVTRVGRFLRKTHLDELPQFINVLRGEMSLVGPRAERPEMVVNFQKEIPFYRARLLVKPGITGWAQINYGYAGTVKETAIKLEYDLYYIEHRSLLMDISIILRTIGTVLGFKGQ
ncbi:MAG TPA: sugar transferase [Brevefilum sp.]|nr:sugar transferase [Brevefilum sp.]HOR18690.1 sugar transferase [Brevefilum sp.]HPL68591.1 sugar transferase [Brevefilum sp.]